MRSLVTFYQAGIFTRLFVRAIAVGNGGAAVPLVKGRTQARIVALCGDGGTTHGLRP